MGETLSDASINNTLEFQSTPVIADGRNDDAAKAAEDARKFQSTPVIADGRNASAAKSCQPSIFSILSANRRMAANCMLHPITKKGKNHGKTTA